MNVVDSQILDIRSEALVKPKFTPPVHGDQIAEPLVSNLVRYNSENVFKTFRVTTS